MDRNEAAIRKHLAPLIGAIVDAHAEHHHVSRAALPTVRRSLRKAGLDLPKTIAECDSDECGPNMVEVPSHAPIKLPADVMLLEQEIDPETNGRIFQTVPVAAFNAMFGALFASGKPTAAEFAAACDATPPEKPPSWDAQPPDPLTGQTPPWPPTAWCRGFCRHAEKWKANGVLR